MPYNSPAVVCNPIFYFSVSFLRPFGEKILYVWKLLYSNKLWTDYHRQTMNFVCSWFNVSDQHVD